MTCSPRPLVAGIVEPQERLEHFLAHVGGDAGAVIVDRDVEVAVVALAGDRDRVGVARRVGDEVGEAALERSRLHRDDRQAVECDGCGVAVALGVAAQLLQRHRHVGRLRDLAGIAAREGEVLLLDRPAPVSHWSERSCDA